MINKQKSSEFGSNVVTLVGGSVVAQALPLAITPILTRLYSPSDFGIFALFIAIVGIFGVVATARYEQAIMLPSSHDEAMELVALSIVISLVVSLFLALLILIFFEPLSIATRLGYWLYGVPFGVFIISLFNTLIAMNNRLGLYRDMAFSGVIKAVIMSIVQILAGITTVGFGGLVGGFLSSNLVANAKLWHNISRLKTHKFNLSKLKVVAKNYKEFPLFQAPHAMLGTGVTYLPIYLLTPFFGSIVVGLYSLSNRVVFAPLSIIAGANAKVYNQHISSKIDSSNRYDFTIKLLRKFAMILIAPFVIFTLFAPSVFGFVFGEEWRVAGEYAQILAPWFFLNSLVSTIAYIPSLLNQQKKALKIAIVHAVLLLLGLTVGIYLHDIKVSLVFFSLFQSMVLIYNLAWMLSLLREHK